MKPDDIYLFPQDGEGDGAKYKRQGGATLRDYFAAKAMQGYVVNFGIGVTSEIARYAYEVSDAMLAQREKQ